MVVLTPVRSLVCLRGDIDSSTLRRLSLSLDVVSPCPVTFNARNYERSWRRPSGLFTPVTFTTFPVVFSSPG